MPRTRVKFCGITSPADAVAAAVAGADAIGMVLHANARRRIDRDTAAAILAALPPLVTSVGLFVDAEAGRMVETADELGLGMLQLHGDESAAVVEAVMPYRVIKAVKCAAETIRTTLDEWRKAVADGGTPNLAAILLEAPTKSAGGTGEANDFGLIQTLQSENAFAGLPPIIVAGGLRPTSVGNVVRHLRPWAVDVSSGIEETFGRKSDALMDAFVREVRAGDHGA